MGTGKCVKNISTRLLFDYYGAPSAGHEKGEINILQGLNENLSSRTTTSSHWAGFAVIENKWAQSEASSAAESQSQHKCTTFLWNAAWAQFQNRNKKSELWGKPENLRLPEYLQTASWGFQPPQTLNSRQLRQKTTMQGGQALSWKPSTQNYGTIHEIVQVAARVLLRYFIKKSGYPLQVFRTLKIGIPFRGFYREALSFSPSVSLSFLLLPGRHQTNTPAPRSNPPSTAQLWLPLPYTYTLLITHTHTHAHTQTKIPHYIHSRSERLRRASGSGALV